MADYTRIETYLTGIKDGTPIPEPYTRVEKLLAEIAEKETSAESVPYDNTTSGLTATTVQGAIDEVAQGGSGGGDVAVIEIDYNGGLFRTVDTAAEVKALVDAGKVLIGRCEVSTGMVVQVGVAICDFKVTSAYNAIRVYTYDGGTGSLVSFQLIASNDDDVFTLST